MMECFCWHKVMHGPVRASTVQPTLCSIWFSVGCSCAACSYPCVAPCRLSCSQHVTLIAALLPAAGSWLYVATCWLLLRSRHAAVRGTMRATPVQPACISAWRFAGCCHCAAGTHLCNALLAAAAHSGCRLCAAQCWPRPCNQHVPASCGAFLAAAAVQQACSCAQHDAGRGCSAPCWLLLLLCSRHACLRNAMHARWCAACSM
jgi:hypothetical protein